MATRLMVEAFQLRWFGNAMKPAAAAQRPMRSPIPTASKPSPYFFFAIFFLAAFVDLAAVFAAGVGAAAAGAERFTSSSVRFESAAMHSAWLIPSSLRTTLVPCTSDTIL